MRVLVVLLIVAPPFILSVLLNITLAPSVSLFRVPISGRNEIRTADGVVDSQLLKVSIQRSMRERRGAYLSYMTIPVFGTEPSRSECHLRPSLNHEVDFDTGSSDIFLPYRFPA